MSPRRSELQSGGDGGAAQPNAAGSDSTEPAADVRPDPDQGAEAAELSTGPATESDARDGVAGPDSTSGQIIPDEQPAQPDEGRHLDEKVQEGAPPTFQPVPACTRSRVAIVATHL